MTGPVHPCPVCGSPDQVCTVPSSPIPPLDNEVVLPSGGPLAVYQVSGRYVRLNQAEAEYRGLI